MLRSTTGYDIQDESKKALDNLGTIPLVVRLENHVVMLEFIVCATLAAQVVL